MHERSCFWKHFGSERVNESLKLLKSEEKYLYPTFSSFWTNLSGKKSFLVISEILGLLVNRLKANYEYSRSNNDNLPAPLQKTISKKSQNILAFFIAFLEFALNLEHYEKKKNEGYSSSISEVVDCQTNVYLNAWKVLFLKTLW